MDKVNEITAKQLNPNIPEFRVGDTVSVKVKITDEAKGKRFQAYEGVVTARKSGGVSETFTVRKISYGVGVDRTFPVHSPNIIIEVLKKGKARRAKLNFLKNLVGQYKFKERG